MLDGKVVAAILQSRDAYDKVSDHLVRDEFSLDGQAWLPLIHEWYANDPEATFVDRETLISKGKPDHHLPAVLWDVSRLIEDDVAQAVAPE